MAEARYRAIQFVHPDIDTSLESAGMQIAATGRIAMVEDEASVRQAILLLLSTMPGERVMRPDYGCELHRLAFASNDDTTAGLAIHYVRQALTRWEPRIDLLHLDAGRDADRPGVLLVYLEYRVRATQRIEQFLLPVDLDGGSNR